MLFQNGCELIRTDFHLHTKKDKEFSYTGDENSFILEYVSTLESQNIRIGVITNHNKFDLDEYKAIRKAAKKKDIFILPGVELSVKEGSNGIHTLIVFNPDEWIKDGENYIEPFLASAFLGIANRENENTRCNYDIPTTINTLEKVGKDYFIIFAHIEQNSGFLHGCQGGLITSLAQQSDFRKRVLGLQKLRTIDKISKLEQWMGYSIALVEGSDPKAIKDIGKGAKSTYIKCGDFSYHAVKYALQDFQNRVYSSSESCKHGYIKSVSFIGGKLDGMTVKFSNELNTFIGIRGSGKSSVLEVLRYALDLPTFIDKEYKNELVKNVLGSGGQISMQVVDKFGKQYEIRRILNESPYVLNSEGKDLSISVRSVINNPLYFGQKDLSFAKEGYELELLQKLVGNKIGTENVSICTYQATLTESLRQLIDVAAIPSQIDELKGENKDIEHKLQVFQEKGVADKLKKQTSCNADLNKIQSALDKLHDVITALENANSATERKDIDLSGYISEYNADIFLEANEVTISTIDILNTIAQNITDLHDRKKALNSVSDKLSKKVDSLKEEFAEIKREIQDDALDPDSFVKYTAEFEKNKVKIGQLQKLSDSRDKLITSIKKSIRERNEALQSIYRAYLAEINKINESQDELCIEIEFKGNKTQFKSDIKNNFKGTGISDVKYQSLCDTFSDFVALIEDYFVNNGEKLHKILSDGEFAKLADKIKANYVELAGIDCPNLVKILYHGKALEKHSIGQRASALMLFILTQQDNDVIIIDQPEDDLDNQVIYKEVIHTIKEKKPFIQFIFATHNANIPVLGDAEKIIVTSYQDNKIAMDEGNIDCPNTHTEVVDIMEGGKEAFEKRKLIYTAWS